MSSASTAAEPITPGKSTTAPGKTTQTTGATDLVNRTAAALAACDGWVTPPGHDFVTSANPRAQHWATMARAAIAALRAADIPDGLRRIQEAETQRLAAKTAQGKVLSDIAALLDCEPDMEGIGQAVEALRAQADLEEDEEPLRARGERLEAELEDYKHRAQVRLADLTEQIELLKAQAKPGLMASQVDLWTSEDLWNAVGLAKGEILGDVAGLLGCEPNLDEIGQAIEALKASLKEAHKSLKKIDGKKRPGAR